MATSPFNIFQKPATSPQMFSKPVTPVPLGVRAVSPTTNVTKPVTTLPSTQKAAPKPVVPSPAQTAPAQPSQPIQSPAPQPMIAQPVAAAQPVQTPAPQTTQGPTYPGLIGSLIKNAQSAQQAGQMSPEEVQARQNLARLKGTAGEAVANIENHPSDLNFQMGREAVLNRNVQAQQGSLADQIAAYAAERGANLQGNTAAASQYGTAISAAQPQLGQYGSTYYNPLQAGEQGQGGDISGAIQHYAQGLANGTIPYSAIPSSITGNPILSSQLLQAAGGGNFNLNQSLGASSAQQANAATTGTYATNLAAQGGSQATQQFNTMNALYGAADAQAKTLQGILASTGINSTNSSDYNKAINQLSGRLGSQNYTQFSTALAELQTMYHNLLSAGGGTPSGNEAQSLALLSPTASANQINGAIYQLQIAANNKLTAQKALADQYNSQLGGGSTGNMGGNTGGTVKAGGFQFKQDASGKWVPA